MCRANHTSRRDRVCRAPAAFCCLHEQRTSQTKHRLSMGCCGSGKRAIDSPTWESRALAGRAAPLQRSQSAAHCPSDRCSTAQHHRGESSWLRRRPMGGSWGGGKAVGPGGSWQPNPDYAAAQRRQQQRSRQQYTAAQQGSQTDSSAQDWPGGASGCPAQTGTPCRPAAVGLWWAEGACQ